MGLGRMSMTLEGFRMEREGFRMGAGRTSTKDGGGKDVRMGMGRMSMKKRQIDRNCIAIELQPPKEIPRYIRYE